MGLWQKFKKWWYKYTYLNDAIQKGDLEGFKKLINRYKLTKRLTATRRGLYFCQKALEAKKTDITRYIMSLANTNKKLNIDDLKEILTHATYNNNLEIAKDVFAQTEVAFDEAFFYFLIYESIKHKSSDVTLLMIDKSIAFLKSKHIKYIFRKAAYYNLLDVVEDLLKREAINLEKHRYFIIWLIGEAVKRGNSNMAILLLKSKVEVSAQNQKDILSYAVVHNDLMVAENILNRQNEILFKNESWILSCLVEQAMIKHHSQMAFLIVSSGAAISPSPNARSLICLAFNRDFFDVMAKIIEQDLLIDDNSVWINYIMPNREKIREAIENDHTLIPEQKLEVLSKIRKNLIELNVVEDSLFAESILKQALKIDNSTKRLQTLIGLEEIKFSEKKLELYQDELIKTALEGSDNVDKWHKLFILVQSSILDDIDRVKNLLYELTKNQKWKRKELLGFWQKLSEIDFESDEQMQNITSFIQGVLNASEKGAIKNSAS